MQKSYINRKKKFFDPKYYRHLPESNIIGNNSDSTHIYYNMQVFNDNTNYDITGAPINTILAVPCNYSQNRAYDFINKPNEYYVSVTHFHIDSNSFPSQIVYPKVGKNYQSTLTSPSGYTLEGVESIYEITLELTWNISGPDAPASSGNASITLPIYWIPLDPSLDPPTFPVKKEDITNEYFWNYTYDYFLDLVNNTISYAMDELSTNNSVTYDGYNPYFTFDGANNLVKFNAPLSFQTDIQGNNINPTVSWKIYTNEPLYQLLQGMESLYNLKYQLLVIPNPDASNIVPQYDSLSTLIQTVNYIQMTTEFSSSFLWNPVVSIVFTSPYFYIVQEIEGKPFISGINPNPPVNNANVLNIIYEYFLGRRADPVVSNFPKAEYRLTGVFGIQPESEMNIETYWKDEFGVLHRFFIEQGAGMNMKLLFRKKTFNK